MDVEIYLMKGNDTHYFLDKHVDNNGEILHSFLPTDKGKNISNWNATNTLRVFDRVSVKSLIT